MSLEFSADAQKKIAALCERYPTKQPVVLAALHLAQKEHGHLSDDALRLVARDARPAVRARVRRRDVLHDVPARAGRHEDDPDVHQHLVHAARRLRGARGVREEARPQEGPVEQASSRSSRKSASRRVPTRRVPSSARSTSSTSRPTQVDEIIAELEARAAPRRRRSSDARRRSEPSSSRALRQRGRATLAGYEKTGGYSALRKALAMRARRHHRTRSRRRTCAAAAARASRPA